jgi:phosphoglycerate-specific signal transduction histidine kinase
MFTSIVILILAVSGLISTVLINKRVDRLQEEINNIKKASEYVSSVNTDNIRGLMQELDNLSNTINKIDTLNKNNFKHFTSRIDKLRNDVLNNSREY